MDNVHGHTFEAAERTRAAKALCAECPVRGECYGYAERTEQRAGIWGGLSFDPAAKRRRRHLVG